MLLVFILVVSGYYLRREYSQLLLHNYLLSFIPDFIALQTDIIDSLRFPDVHVDKMREAVKIVILIEQFRER